MSWSIPKISGKPEKIRDLVEKSFDNAAKYYEGKTEGADIHHAKALVSTFLDECNCAENEAALVSAYGSRASGHLGITIECSKVQTS